MLEVSVTHRIDEVPQSSWDTLCGADHPFVEHAYLKLMETSGSVGPGTGWRPHHLLVHDDGRLVGAAPTYLKSDSYGEYIFDWGWAEAAMAAGLRYYPKLVVGVPFTPATGPRLLTHPEADPHVIRGALLEGLRRLQEESGASGSHLLFTLDEEAELLETLGFARRATHQYHWFNHGFADFDDFLCAFRSSARKQIRKERRRVREAGLRVELKTGAQIDEETWSVMHQLYLDTYSRKWGRPYLTKAFFEDAGAALGERSVVVTARRGTQIIGATLSFQKGKHLYGRYWGAFEPIDGLHFELCYYRLIEHAIEAQMDLFEAGAQGQHKLRRGFIPVTVHSAHRVAHPGLHDAIARFTTAERQQLPAALRAMADEVPFRRDDPRRSPRAAGTLPQTSDPR